MPHLLAFYFSYDYHLGHDHGPFLASEGAKLAHDCAKRRCCLVLGDLDPPAFENKLVGSLIFATSAVVNFLITWSMYHWHHGKGLLRLIGPRS